MKAPKIMVETRADGGLDLTGFYKGKEYRYVLWGASKSDARREFTYYIWRKAGSLPPLD